MGCSKDCDEGHTYRPGCMNAATGAAVDTPTRLLTRGRQAAELSRRAVAIETVDRCWNLMCDNLPGEGRFTIYLMWVNDKPFAAPLCAPCAAMLREAVTG